MEDSGTAIILMKGNMMHFEVLVEDKSGKIALEYFLEKILGPNGQNHSFRIKSYKGIGHIPKNLKGKTDPSKRILLDQLPRLLRGYGKSFRDVPASVIVVVDLDDKDCILFKRELLDILAACNPKPSTLFRIAIEEIEAWLLGDNAAVNNAYPNAIYQVLNDYIPDSICGTWEKLADAVYPDGSQALKKKGWPFIGQEKCKWAEKIAPNIDIDTNKSKSFQVFRDGIKKIAGIL